MNRLRLALPTLLLLAACDVRAPAPAPKPSPTPSSGFDNGAAAQSIMQPDVIAASKPEPTPTVSPPPTGATILFEQGAALDDEGRAALDALLAAPALPADARWVLRGSSDNDGSAAANLRVSGRRAEAVRAYLVAHKVDPARITVVALGSGRPAAPNVNLDGSDDPAGRRKNRRVDVEIVAPTTEPAPPTTGADQPVTNAQD
ncbi:OmpA family protein [Sphingomonas sp. Mn802worker]|uniref:OmpA family protein n=1 Tax=Sphingomonas sp. Mn802worker TaxID=629773 RepID=UPI00036641B0|nr:OmpA family protein [Sphingomonas sp. Mn802worker]